MPRKFRSIHSDIDEKCAVFSIPTDECDRWIRASPNTINCFTEFIGACEKLWSTRCEK